MELAQAKQLANELITALTPACDRIEIAGGVRRGKAEPHDIELVCVPDLAHKPRLELGKPAWASKTLLDTALWELERAGRIVERVKYGDKYKQLRLREGLTLDLFVVTPPAQWGVIFTIRTGPGSKENNFSRWIVTPRSSGGALPSNLYVSNGAVWMAATDGANDDQLVVTPEEKDFFRVLGLPWLEPAARCAQWNALPDLLYRPEAESQAPAPAEPCGSKMIPSDDPAALLAGLPADVKEYMGKLGDGIHIRNREMNVG